MEIYSLVFFILALFISLVFSFIFSGGETSIIASNIAKLNKLKIQGKKNVELAIKLKSQQENVIGSILLANNLLNIFSSAVVTYLSIELLGSIGILVSTIVTTFTILIFAEILPKTYALNHPEKVSIKLSKILLFFVTILSPIVSCLNYIVTAILKTIDQSKESENVSPYEAIKNLILLHKKNEDKSIMQQNLEVISNILDMTEAQVDKIITHRKDIFSINTDLPEQEIIDMALSHDYKNIPLWKEKSDNYIDILNAEKIEYDFKKGKKIILKNYKEKPTFVPETVLISTQLHNFKKQKNDFAIVIDEYSNIKGIITLFDILNEIIGNTIENHGKSDIKKISKNHYTIGGKALIRSINRELNINLPVRNQTLAGMLINEAKRIPEEGEKFLLHKCTFKILKKKLNTIILIDVTLN